LDFLRAVSRGVAGRAVLGTPVGCWIDLFSLMEPDLEAVGVERDIGSFADADFGYGDGSCSIDDIVFKNMGLSIEEFEKSLIFYWAVY